MADIKRRVACKHDLSMIQVGFDCAVQRGREAQIRSGELCRMLVRLFFVAKEFCEKVAAIGWHVPKSTRKLLPQCAELFDLLRREYE